MLAYLYGFKHNNVSLSYGYIFYFYWQLKKFKKKEAIPMNIYPVHKTPENKQKLTNIFNQVKELKKKR